MQECREQLKFFLTQEEKFCIFKQPCNVLFIIIININEIPNYFTLVFSFAVKGTIYYVAISNIVIVSHVKISFFHPKAHLMFCWCLIYNQQHYPLYRHCSG